MEEQKLSRVVIKEELVELTGDFIKAVLLNQFIYWSERVRDFDKFIQEERSRVESDGKELNIDLQNGWIYKKSEELSKETMLNMTAKSIRNHVKELVSRGFLSERTNPKFKWDKTMQYRVNLTKIQDELYKINYHLEGYKVSISRSENISVQEEKNTLQEVENYAAIPETTTETKTDINIYTVFDFWNSKKIISHSELTDKRKGHINAKLKKFPVEEIIQTIDNYDAVLRSPDCYWSHKYKLEDFLTRGFDNFRTVNEPFENYKVSNSGNKNTASAKQNIDDKLRMLEGMME